jgi:hypothetical protein
VGARGSLTETSQRGAVTAVRSVLAVFGAGVALSACTDDAVEPDVAEADPVVVRLEPVSDPDPAAPVASFAVAETTAFDDTVVTVASEVASQLDVDETTATLTGAGTHRCSTVATRARRSATPPPSKPH